MSNQEQIVDDIVINQLVDQHPELKPLVKSTSKFAKRKALLSIIDVDRKLYEDYKKLDEINTVENYMTYSDEVVCKIREYVKVADTEVKELGEVMTPIWLVEDMLNTLPQEVWTNPNLKWLDPCSGVGTFSSIVVQRLMKGLENVKGLKNPNKRYSHIIENMLHVCELQPKNMFVFHCVFDKEDTFELNTYCGSFLDEGFDNHMKEVWDVEKFDVIVGNPPYQIQKEGNTKTHPLWHLFVEKSISLSNEDGYLNMVHPSGWREVDGYFKKIQKLLSSKQIIKLKMHNYNDGLKTFGCKVSYDYYTLKNSFNDKHITNIICVDGTEININLKEIEFLPDENVSEIFSLVAKDGEEKVSILHSYSQYETRKSYMSKNKTNDFIYPCINAISSENVPSCYYSNTKSNGHFGVPKVMFSNVASGLIIDDKGEYGLTQFAYGIVDDVNNLENIKKALANEKFIKKIMLYRNYGFKYNRKVIATFRKDFWKEFVNEEQKYLSKCDESTKKCYYKLQDEILKLGDVKIKYQKDWISFVDHEDNVICKVRFYKNHILLSISRGNLLKDGTESKYMFHLNDERKITVVREAKFKVKRTSQEGSITYYHTNINDTTDLDYIIDLVKQKYNHIKNK